MLRGILQVVFKKIFLCQLSLPEFWILHEASELGKVFFHMIFIRVCIPLEPLIYFQQSGIVMVVF